MFFSENNYFPLWFSTSVFLLLNLSAYIFFLLRYFCHLHANNCAPPLAIIDCCCCNTKLNLTGNFLFTTLQLNHKRIMAITHIDNNNKSIVKIIHKGAIFCMESNWAFWATGGKWSAVECTRMTIWL